MRLVLGSHSGRDRLGRHDELNRESNRNRPPTSRVVLQGKVGGEHDD